MRGEGLGCQGRGSTVGPRVSLLAHCEGEPEHHCDPLTPRGPWDMQVGLVGSVAEWAGGLGALVALGTAHGHG